MQKGKPILSIRNLHTYFYTYSGVAKVLEGINLDIYKGDIAGLVGETGCGKSLTALSILRLVDPPGKIVHGEIWYKGENLLEKSEKEMRKVRGSNIAMVFQDPTTNLNPVYKIGTRISEVIKLHQNLSKKEKNSKSFLKEKVIDILRLVEMPDPARVFKQYPHELSTGMKQRVMIAIMISCNPDLLIADEATTALDVTIQAQILKLFEKLTKKMNTSILIITHDLGIIAKTCKRVHVMYAGKIVESAETFELFDNYLHPYTTGLLKAIPRPHKKAKRLKAIDGFVPSLISPPSGCRFHPRCPYVMQICKKKEPSKVKVGPDHYVFCHLIK